MDLNLGPKYLSLLEFQTWGFRPLGHHGRCLAFIITQSKAKTIITRSMLTISLILLFQGKLIETR